jgi:monovalent cation/proton antiporter MnhG/PhaG subunit
MSWQSVAIPVLLALGVAVVLFSALGVALMRSVFDQAHFVTPAATVGLACVTAAVLVQEAFSSAGIQMLLITLVLFVTGPVVTHATLRVAHTREYASWVRRTKSDDRPPAHR